MTACPTAATPDGPNAEANVEPLCRQLEAFQAAYARDNHTRRLEHDAILNRLSILEYRLEARAHNNNRRENRRRGDDLQMIPKLLPSRGRNSANVGDMPPLRLLCALASTGGKPLFHIVASVDHVIMFHASCVPVVVLRVCSLKGFKLVTKRQLRARLVDRTQISVG
ncbi:unnamed protein product [Aphanomyces euteiches]|nr:hypothetical protein Ae201684P_017159 [Aphanomyces euteiches]KAH9153376.1 hypothetical protein AeRB84_004368 [Aphanomyces euteiches]